MRALFEQVPQDETKTQRKVKLLSGDVVVKKSKLDFELEIKSLFHELRVDMKKPTKYF